MREARGNIARITIGGALLGWVLPLAPLGASSGGPPPIIAFRTGLGFVVGWLSELYAVASDENPK